MDYPSLLAKITGAGLLFWTFRSIYRHFLRSRLSFKKLPGGTPVPPEAGETGKQPDKKTSADQTASSVSEKLLNHLLLYLWLAFMLAFSIGMIVNN